jgi:type II secretory pathway predicted ATPase ExeA
MYLDYFSLKRHPFRITPDPSLFFAGGAHGRGVVLDALVYAITSGEGILKVVGEVGSGKTMLCRMLEERLPASVEIVYLANPNLSARDIIYAIAFELKLAVEASTDRLVVMHKLQDYLLQRHSGGASVVVFIEEAQSMPLETLEEIRLLSNLETHRHKLMQIVLFGQPELDRKLQDKTIRQLRERITHSFNLEPLTADEVRAYLHFRLQTAGCPWPQLFSPKSERILAKASEGLTRRINILADKALLASYADPAARQEPRSSSGEIMPMVLPRHVKIAVADSAYGSRFMEQYLPWSGYAVAVVAVALLIFVLFKYVWIGNESLAVTASISALAAPIAEAQTDAASPTSPAVVAPLLPASDAALPAAAELPVELVPRNNGNAPINANRKGPNEAEEQPTTEVLDPSLSAVNKQTNAGVIVELARPAITPRAATTTEAIQAEQSQADAVADNTNDLLASTVEAAILSDALIDDRTPEQNEHADSAAPVVPSTASQQKPSYTFTGLAATRSTPSAEWLASLSNKIGYTVQISSALTRQPEKLEQFLVILASNQMLDQVFLCVISGNNSRPEQWLILYNEFRGLSEAQKRIEGFPPDINQYAPYTRNLNDIECAN